MKKFFSQKIKKIKWFILDVDGVLTDGKIIISSQKEELKNFDVKDGVGIHLAQLMGYKFAIISGRYSKVITLRAEELKIKEVYQNVSEKIKEYEKIKEKFNLKDAEICFIGDDLIDIPVLKKCGFAVVPCDAVDEVKRVADYVCKNPGGNGCVRETIEVVLKKQKKWISAINRYLKI